MVCEACSGTPLLGPPSLSACGMSIGQVRPSVFAFDSSAAECRPEGAPKRQSSPSTVLLTSLRGARKWEQHPLQTVERPHGGEGRGVSLRSAGVKTQSSSAYIVPYAEFKMENRYVSVCSDSHTFQRLVYASFNSLCGVGGCMCYT